MDILRKNLDLVVQSLETMLSKSSGKSDGPIIDVLRLAQSSRDVAYSIKAPRRWIPVEERLPSENGRYEVVTGNGVDYLTFHKGVWRDEDDMPVRNDWVTHWRKQPKFPRS